MRFVIESLPGASALLGIYRLIADTRDVSRPWQFLRHMLCPVAIQSLGRRRPLGRHGRWRVEHSLPEA